MADQPKGRGGRRLGAGRRPSGDTPLSHTGYPVRLTAEQLEYVRSNGGAEFVRRLIDQHIEKERKSEDGPNT